MTQEESIQKSDVFWEDQTRRILNGAGGVIAGGHFVYTKGGHGKAYVAKDKVYLNPNDISVLCRGIADHFHVAGIQYDTVAAAAVGGVVMSQYVAQHGWSVSGPGTPPICAVYAEKKESAHTDQPVDGGQALTRYKDLVFNRGYAQEITGKKVLVVEDIINTGDTVTRLVQAVREAGGEVVGVGALCNRGTTTAESLGVPELYALLNVEFEVWPEDECPLCREGVPVNLEFGKGRDFLARKKLDSLPQ